MPISTKTDAGVSSIPATLKTKEAKDLVAAFNASLHIVKNQFTVMSLIVEQLVYFIEEEK